MDKQYTVLYSKTVDETWPDVNRCILDNGVEIKYTCIVDERVHGPWQHNYNWPDAQVVGYINNDQISYHGSIKH